MAPNACWGIEIGSGAIKALKLESDGDAVRVADYAVIDHVKVLSTPEIDPDDVLRVSLGSLVANKDLSGAAMAISVPGHQSFARFAKLPPVEPKRVPDIVKFEAVQQIPFPLEDVEWDYQTFVNPDSPDVEVGIFAITRPRIMERLTMLGDLGLSPDVATIGPVAAYNAMAFDLEFTEDTPGTIILDVGTTASDLIIAEGGRVWVRTFPVGGHQFTEAIASQFNIRYEKAEKVKREAQDSKHARHVFQAMRPVFTDLVQEIQRSIGYYQSIHADAKLSRLIGLGNTFHLPGLRKYLKQQLQMDVYRLEQFKRTSIDAKAAGDFNNAAMNLATAYGLALQGLGNGTLNANLMPIKVVREAVWRRKRGWLAAATGVAAAAAAAAFVRPLLDYSAFTSAERSNAILTAGRDAQRVSQAARSAGVSDGAEGDLEASRIIGLLEGGDLYSLLVADVETMLAAVRSTEAGAGLSVELRTLNAGFKPPEQASESFGGGWQQQQQETAPSEGLDAKSFERIEVEAIITASGEGLAATLRETLMPWFTENARRDGVPYVLVPGVAEAASAADLGATRGNSTTQRPGRQTRPDRRTMRDQGGRIDPRMGGQPMGQPGGPGGGFPDDDTSSGDELDREAIETMQQQAPITPDVLADGAEASPRQAIVLRWSMVLNAPTEAEGGAS